MIIKKKLILLGIFIALPFLISALVVNNSATTSPENIEVTEKIRLYSNGKLIDEWIGIGRGELEENSYIFTVSRGAFREEVRIQGDFVVERSSN